MKVKVECPACGGDGLYHGYSENYGEFVPCDKCKGLGFKEMEKFEVLKTPPATFKYVTIDGKAMSYQQFLEWRELKLKGAKQ